MKIVPYDQRSPEWLDWRLDGVGASDTATILGLSPYKTIWRLWAEKVRLVDPVEKIGLMKTADLSRNPNVRRGVSLEVKARIKMEEVLDDILMPLCAESDENSIIRASFDGLTSDNYPTELKCPTENIFRDFVANGVNSDFYNLYRPQVEHQMYVANVDMGYLVAFYYGEIHYVIIKRDQSRIDIMVEALLDFDYKVKNNIEPEKDVTKDFYIPENEDATTWKFIASDYRKNALRISQIKKELEIAKSTADSFSENLFELMGDYSLAESFGLKIARFNKSGTIDYKAALAFLVPTVDPSELERFRRKSSQSSRITLKTEDTSEVEFDLEEIEKLSPDDYWF